MDFAITINDDNIKVVIHSDDSLTEKEIERVFSPIRKATQKNVGATPTLIFPKNWHANNIYRIEFIGGRSVSNHNLKTAVDEFIRQLRAYKGSPLGLEAYVSKLQTEFGITDDDDIAVINPEEEIERRLRRRFPSWGRQRYAATSN